MHILFYTFMIIICTCTCTAVGVTVIVVISITALVAVRCCRGACKKNNDGADKLPVHVPPGVVTPWENPPGNTAEYV